MKTIKELERYKHDKFEQRHLTAYNNSIKVEALEEVLVLIDEVDKKPLTRKELILELKKMITG